MKKSMKRRAFLQNGTLATAGMLLTAGSFPFFKSPANFSSERLAAVDFKAARKIGNLKVSPLGLGCMNMAGIYNAPQDRSQMIKLIREAYEQGVDFFDTAEVYGPFYSEELVGAALQPFRNKVNIATKFGFEYNGKQVTGRDSSPQSIRNAVEGMLKRLQTDVIDLLYLHRMDPNTPIEDIAGTVKELINEGKVRNFGLSEVAPETIRRAHSIQPVAALQSEYSMLERVMEYEMLDLCESLNIAFVPWGPLCRGMLTGRFDKNFKPDPQYRRAGVPYFTPEALEVNLKVTQLATLWASEKNATPAQFALAWLMAQKPFIVPIPGTTNNKHLKENLGALDLKLSAEDLKEFRLALEQLPTIGFRTKASIHEDL